MTGIVSEPLETKVKTDQLVVFMEVVVVAVKKGRSTVSYRFLHEVLDKRKLVSQQMQAI